MSVRKALRALRAGEDDLAARHLNEAGAEGSASIVEGIGWFLLRRPNKAARLLAQCSRSGSPALRALALRTHADLCGELGWNHEARASLEQWVRLEPSAPAPRRRLVDLLARSRDWEDAGALLESADRLPLRRAAVLRELGHPEEAVDQLRRLHRPGRGAPARRRLAEQLARCGAVDDALEILDGTTAAELADRSRLLLFAGRNDAGLAEAKNALASGAEGE
ncbi:MAG: hypothetical protein KDA24_09110, partial [Deltaproteobacteria bacterium]|nr:hypothetical protein [Deltaproteobacteria bacterium]